MSTQGAWGSKFHVLSSLWWGIYNLQKAKEIRKLRLVLTFFPIYTFVFPSLKGDWAMQPNAELHVMVSHQAGWICHQHHPICSGGEGKIQALTELMIDLGGRSHTWYLINHYTLVWKRLSWSRLICYGVLDGTDYFVVFTQEWPRWDGCHPCAEEHFGQLSTQELLHWSSQGARNSAQMSGGGLYALEN